MKTNTSGPLQQLTTSGSELRERFLPLEQPEEELPTEGVEALDFIAELFPGDDDAD